MSIGPIILQVVLILLNAVFASAEIAVISMNETKLRQHVAHGNAKAIRLNTLISQPARFLATIQVAITMANLLGSAFAAENFAELIVDTLMERGVPVPEEVLSAVSIFFITLILAYFSIVFGELVPKRIAMKKAEQLALMMSGMLSFVSKAFKPLVWLLTASTNGILKLIHINPEEEEERVTEEEINMLLIEGSEQGTIGSLERELIQNVFEFDDINAEQICTHRNEVTALSLDDDMKLWDKVIQENRHTYYPVCKENKDEVVGILDTRDYFRLTDRSRENVLEKAMDHPFYVPERMKADVVLQNMKHKKIYFAVIVDEYGGMAGIITLHDLVEALVGDIKESEDEEQPDDIIKVNDREWCIQGSAPVDKVEACLGMQLPAGKYDTFGGYIYNIIDRVPSDGESFFCESDGLKIKVHNVQKHRIMDTTVYLNAEQKE